MPTRELAIAADHPAFAGHFPGQPVLPGVVLVAEVLEALLGDPALAIDPGRPLGLRQVKFLSPVMPGERLLLSWQAGPGQVVFTISRGDATLAARGEFDLAANHG